MKIDVPSSCAFKSEGYHPGVGGRGSKLGLQRAVESWRHEAECRTFSHFPYIFDTEAGIAVVHHGAILMWYVQ